MSDIKLFEKWIKKSIKNRFVFQARENDVIVTDGYIAYRIDRGQKAWMEAIKSITFQSLESNFIITYKSIKHEHRIDLASFFNESKYKSIDDTSLLYTSCGEKLRVFRNEEDEYIFVKQNYIESVTGSMMNYDIKGSTNISLIMLIQDKIQIGILPVRITAFPYKIVSR